MGTSLSAHTGFFLEFTNVQLMYRGNVQRWFPGKYSFEVVGDKGVVGLHIPGFSFGGCDGVVIAVYPPSVLLFGGEFFKEVQHADKEGPADTSLWRCWLVPYHSRFAL